MIYIYNLEFNVLVMLWMIAILIKSKTTLVLVKDFITNFKIY